MHVLCASGSRHLCNSFSHLPLTILLLAATAAIPQARKNLDATIKRVKESESRIDSAIKPSVDKAYW